MTIAKILSTILAISMVWLSSISPAKAEAPSGNIVRMNEIFEWFIAQPLPPQLSEPEQKQKLLELWASDSVVERGELTIQQLYEMIHLLSKIDQVYMHHSVNGLVPDQEAQTLNLVKYQDEVILNYVLFIKIQMTLLKTVDFAASMLSSEEAKKVRIQILKTVSRALMYLNEPRITLESRNRIMQTLTDNATLIGTTFGNEERKNVVSVLRKKVRVQPDVQKDYMNFLKEMYNAPCNAICEAK